MSIPCPPGEDLDPKLPMVHMTETSPYKSYPRLAPVVCSFYLSFFFFFFFLLFTSKKYNYNKNIFHQSSLSYLSKNMRGLSQEVVDFSYNKKTIRSSAIKFYMWILPSFLHLHAKFQRKISNNEVCALILPAIGLTNRRTSYKLLMTSESLQL